MNPHADHGFQPIDDGQVIKLSSTSFLAALAVGLSAALLGGYGLWAWWTELPSALSPLVAAVLFFVGLSFALLGLFGLYMRSKIIIGFDRLQSICAGKVFLQIPYKNIASMELCDIKETLRHWD
jgi:hypothetical protein